MKFALVGGAGVFVNAGVAWLFSSVVLGGLADRGLADQTALAAGIVVSIFTNFVINDAWTWGDRAKGGGRDWVRRAGLYYLTNGVAALLQYGVSSAALAFFPAEGLLLGLAAVSVRAPLASLIGIAVATPLNYVVNNLWTFRDRSD